MTRALIIAVVTTAVLGFGPAAVPARLMGQEAIDHPRPQPWLEAAVSPLTRDDLRLQPAASCAAAACHGGPQPGVAEPYAARGSEYPLWLELDPHARSWTTLCSPQSVAILNQVAILRDGHVVDQAGFDNCLKCHNTTRRYEEPRSASVFHGEGVGCAACHGPDQLWRREHVREDWSAETAAARGMVATHDLLARARMCASCHVGDSDRDMNHDIIAAGHPSLHFEFSSHHARLPKHWREPERERQSDFEAQLWLAGQVAALDASLSLLVGRAGQCLPVSQWPEFATADCSSCHQALRLADPSEELVGLRPAAAYSDWHSFGMHQVLADQDSHSAGHSLEEKLQQIRSKMNAASIPDPVGVANAADEARAALDEWLSSAGVQRMATFSADQLQRIATTAARDPQTHRSWETLAQCYLAMVAARSQWLDPEARALVTARRLRGELVFQPGSSAIAILDRSPDDANPAELISELARQLEGDVGAVPDPRQ